MSTNSAIVVVSAQSSTSGTANHRSQKWLIRNRAESFTVCWLQNSYPISSHGGLQSMCVRTIVIVQYRVHAHYYIILDMVTCLTVAASTLFRLISILGIPTGPFSCPRSTRSFAGA
ncbi:hypothetical protein I7I48_03223 [Histoplasma ohiense]|nr:hypothetical protein I7I48_03223 [Histoplasma ohiense (nom. inval.)]